MNRIKREPTGIVAFVIVLLGAIVYAAVGFGLNWTDEQVKLVLAVFAAAAPVVTWLISRYYTTPLSDPRSKDGTSLVPFTDIK